MLGPWVRPSLIQYNTIQYSGITGLEYSSKYDAYIPRYPLKRSPIGPMLTFLTWVGDSFSKIRDIKFTNMATACIKIGHLHCGRVSSIVYMKSSCLAILIFIWAKVRSFCFTRFTCISSPNKTLVISKWNDVRVSQYVLNISPLALSFGNTCFFIASEMLPAMRLSISFIVRK